MSKSERRKLLEQKMKELNKGNAGFATFGDSKEELQVLPTNIPDLDKFIGGGLPKGHFSVIYGGESTGKTTLALQTIANAQKNGNIVCLIDLEHGWDIDRAKSMGVNLEELVLVENANNAEEALDVMIKLSKDKLVDLFVVDSIQAMSPKEEQETSRGKEKSVADNSISLLARKLGQFFRMGAQHIYRSKASVLMIGQIRTQGIGSFFVHAGLSGGEALKHWMHLCLFMRHGQKADAPTEKVEREVETPDGVVIKKSKEQVGFDCVLKLEKTKSGKSAKQGDDIHLPFYYTNGFPVAEEVIEESDSSEKELTQDEVKIEEITEDEAKEDDNNAKKIIEKFSKKGRKKALKNLTEEEFQVLKSEGMLLEIYPDAPEKYEEIK